MASENRRHEAHESEWAARFSRDVDILLRATGRMEEPTPPPDYAETLDLAQILVTIDWSAASRQREYTRQRLATGEVDEASRSTWNWPRLFSWRRHPVALALVSALVLAFILVPLAWPGALTASAQGIETMVHRIVLRRPLTVRFFAMQQNNDGNVAIYLDQGTVSQIEMQASVAPPVTYITEPAAVWTMDTPIGEFHGVVPPGFDATIREYTTLEAIESDWGHLHQPSYLPKDYVFSKARMAPQNSVYVYYTGPQSEVIVAQTRREQVVMGKSAPSGAFATMTRKRIEWVPMGPSGEMARWIEGHGLIWQDDDTSYLVGGPDLTLTEAERIAVSLR